MEAALLVVTSCFSVTELQHAPTSTPVAPDRAACGEILGSAFRSPDEQAWFVENCSAWVDATLGEVSEPAGPASPSPGAEAPRRSPQPALPPTGTPVPPPTPTPQPPPLQAEERCAAQQGRLYATPADREWYQQNCNGQPTGPAVQGESRDCDEIRGRPYASEAQRQWFLTNCGGTQAAGQGDSAQGQSTQPSVGPNGRPCSAIYGTRYQSGAEYEWFQANCL